MLNDSEYKSIFPIRPLIENFWVFFLFGMPLGITGGAMAKLDMDTNTISQLMLEPISTGYFLIIHLFSATSIAACSIYAHKKGKDAIDCQIVCAFFLPIASNGLSIGAIIAGSMLGLGIGFQIAQALFGYIAPKTIFNCISISLSLIFFTVSLGIFYTAMLFREPGPRIRSAWRKLARLSP